MTLEPTEARSKPWRIAVSLAVMGVAAAALVVYLAREHGRGDPALVNEPPSPIVVKEDAEHRWRYE